MLEPKELQKNIKHYIDHIECTKFCVSHCCNIVFSNYKEHNWDFNVDSTNLKAIGKKYQASLQQHFDTLWQRDPNKELQILQSFIQELNQFIDNFASKLSSTSLRP